MVFVTDAMKKLRYMTRRSTLMRRRSTIGPGTSKQRQSRLPPA